MKGIHLRYLVYGALLGYSLSRMGFTNYDEVHSMFVFSDLRLLFTFFGGVTLSGVGFWFLARRGGKPPPRRIHPGSVPGGILFGLGWALTGACPGVVFSQLGEGHGLALITLAGVFLGNWIFGKAHGRLFRFNPGSCES
jgi:uncharacterized membrane protein YedE/YeeE